MDDHHRNVLMLSSSRADKGSRQDLYGLEATGFFSKQSLFQMAT